MPAIGQTLSVGISTGMNGMAAVTLYAMVANLIDPTSADPDVENGLRQLTTWFAARFMQFTTSTMLTSVIGQGPVPAYAPPTVLAGPVIGGTIMPSRGVLVGPNLFLMA